MVRLQRYLAECGVASRRAAEKLILEGRVKVNGCTAQLGVSVEPASDRIEVDGVSVGQDQKIYILLNKPPGVISSVHDPHGRRTVIDCLGHVAVRVFPVGRLDYDTEGALLLTNDGDLAHRLMHPSFEVDKVYLAWVEGHVTPETAQRLEEGIELEDGLTAPAKVMVMHAAAKSTLLQITLHEGRKREVKRMCEAVGHRVRQLQRTAIGHLRLKGLKPGQWRYLNEAEVAGLYRTVGLSRNQNPR